MRTIAMALVVAPAVILNAAAALADQSDPRLAKLFAQLKATKDGDTGSALTRSIWEIWFQSKNPAVRQLVSRGQAHLRARRFRIAAELFNHVVKIAPRYAEGWNRRATVRYLLGNHKGSLADIERTLKLEPRHFGALSGRGLVLLALEDAKLALQSFEAAIEIHPKLPGANLNAEALRRQIEKNEI